MATSKKKTASQEEAKEQVSYSPAAQRVLTSPRVSEKAVKLTESGKYVFNVSKDANKIEVKKAVEETYKVQVRQVNMVNVKGKARTFGRTRGKTSGFKKAVVSLKAGQAIKGAIEAA